MPLVSPLLGAEMVAEALQYCLLIYIIERQMFCKCLCKRPTPRNELPTLHVARGCDRLMASHVDRQQRHEISRCINRL
jgi:hypothetical protein